MNVYARTVSALCYTILKKGRNETPIEQAARLNGAVDFVLGQNNRMPDFLRFPMRTMTMVFAMHAVLRRGRFFHGQESSSRWAHFQAWKDSRLGFCRDFARYYESLATVHWHAPDQAR